MQSEQSDLTVIGQNARTERLFRSSELLRAELAPFVHPKALTEMLDLAAQAAEKAPVEDVLREMRATIAGMLLNRVGAFMLATQVSIEQHAERTTRPPAARARAAA